MVLSKSSLKPKTQYVYTYHNRQIFCSCKVHISHVIWLNTEGSANFVVMTNDFIFSVHIKYLPLDPCDCIKKIQSVDIAACSIVGCRKNFLYIHVSTNCSFGPPLPCPLRLRIDCMLYWYRRLYHRHKLFGTACIISSVGYINLSIYQNRIQMKFN